MIFGPTQMKLHLPSPFLYHYCLLFTSLSILPSGFYCQEDNYTMCYHHYICGDIQGVWYPFWGGDIKKWCGRSGFKLDCIHYKYAMISMGLGKLENGFHLLSLDQSRNTVKIARWDLWHDVCLQNYTLSNTTLDVEHFSYASNVRNLSLFYGCPHVPGKSKQRFSCPNYGGKSNYYVEEGAREELVKVCKANIVAPVSKEVESLLIGGKKKLKEVFREGFDVTYEYPEQEGCKNCLDSGGICGSSRAAEFICHHFDQPKSGTPKRKPNKLFIAIGLAAAAVLICCITSFCYRSLRKTINSSNRLSAVCIKKTENDHVKVLITDFGLFAPKRYRYSDIKKMTNSFKDKLGEGGWGCVYKGRLLDSRPVAVKILNVSKAKGGEFINEVTSISRTSHVNIVSLLGFCLEGDRRALVYEFMANGSLEKFIYNGNASNDSQQHLGWEKLYQISIGIARGLAYLHRGCSTRILHFDIKPHNILLDENFQPKISDFGLAKLCSKQESIISMKEARGTIGYIAPEVFSRNFGGVSHKSDVYSYGMMVLEMVSGRKNKNVKAEKASEIYFPEWAYMKIRSGNDLELCCVMSNQENEIARKLVLVGLWCIQAKPSDRPSMTEVMAMLAGSVEALKDPPKSFMFSSPNSGCDIMSEDKTMRPASEITKN